MRFGALLLSGIRRVEWLVDDPTRGAMRELRDGARYRELFARIEMVGRPEPELEARMLDQPAAWYRRHGKHHPRWVARGKDS